MKKAIIFVLLCVFSLSLVLGLTACASDKIAMPDNLTVDEENTLTWDEVDNCKGYTIEVTDYVTKEVKEFSTRKATYSLTVLTEGDYDIRIQALPSTRRLKSSDWSKTMFFHKEYETGCVYALINNDREYEISRVGRASGAFTLEDEYRGKPVTRIADGAFRKSRSITLVTLGKNIAYIGESAFNYCTNLETIVIPNTVSEIGSSCFQLCTSLKEVNIPTGVSVIGNNTFESCKSLKSITLHDRITEIGESAFNGCVALTEVTIPDSVEVIYKSAFSGCSSLAKVTLGEGLVYIYNSAFSKCDLSEGVQFGTSGNLVYIGNYAFSYCTGLKGADIPEGVELIGTNCFTGSTNFEHITIPDSCSYVGYAITYKTKMFTEEENETGTEFIYADKWLVGVPQPLKDNLKYIGGTKQAGESDDERIQIRSGTVGIAVDACQRMLQLEEVTLPNSIKYISGYAFERCEKLWSFNAYSCKNLVSLGTGVFYEDILLSSVSLGSNLKEIGEYCFYKCESLHLPDESNIHRIMPDSIEEVGGYAFYKSGIWDDAEEESVIYVGNWAVGRGSAGTSSITLKAGTVGIANYALSDATGEKREQRLTSVKTTDESLLYIGEGAFYCCSELITFEIGSYVKHINDFTFYGCESYQNAGRPLRLEHIGRSAFYDCQSLKTFDLSSCQDLSEIGIFAFGYCSSLEEIYLPEFITEIKPYTFYECDALKSVSIPEGVESIGKQAFLGCDNLQTVTFEQSENATEGLEVIGDSAFYLCYSIEEIALPDTVTTVSDSAFYGCVGIKELKLSDSLTYIGDSAFYNLNVLTDVIIGKNVEYIGTYAFGNCENLKSITLSKEVEWIGAYAFFQCSFSTIYTDATEALEDWHGRVNPSYLPIVWGVTLSDDASYVVSFTKTETSVENANEYNRVTAPSRKGYDFVGWTTVEGGTSPEYGASDLVSLENGVTVYAIWRESSAE